LKAYRRANSSNQPHRWHWRMFHRVETEKWRPLIETANIRVQ
jgi:hypothetical protein